MNVYNKYHVWRWCIEIKWTTVDVDMTSRIDHTQLKDLKTKGNNFSSYIAYWHIALNSTKCCAV